MVYQQAVRKVLFRIGGGDAEVAHERTLRALSLVAKAPPLLTGMRGYFAADRPRTVLGVRFPSVVGLAAGMDKNGVALPAWPALGFGHVEVGTVTWHPQPGNPRPRLYRLPASQALINRMGFNNDGAIALAARLRSLGKLPVPLGISIGKSKLTPVADAVEDYLKSLRELYSYGDYFAVNVSSPNTPGLRSLQDRAALAELAGALTSEARGLAGGNGTPKPLLVKIAPDLTEHAIGELLEVCTEHGVRGIIACNTTVERDGLSAADAPIAAEAGGLSGLLLAARAREVVRFVHAETAGKLPIIGVGGITSTDDAARMLDAGASLLQLYTGFIYAGPGLVRRIARSL
ncbi:MAG: quinone-dependent dihydroorotate dehydrogenase [Sciscionella sp.]